MLLICRKFTMIADLVFEVFIAQTEDMMNLQVRIWDCIIFFWIFCLIKLSRGKYLPFELITHSCSFRHRYFRTLIINNIINLLSNLTILNLLLRINLLLLQFIILLSQRRIISPYQYWLLLSTNTHNILYLIRFLLMCKFNSSYSIGMSLVFIVNDIIECRIVE